MENVLKYLKQPSTKSGIGVVLGIFEVQISEGLTSAIFAILVAGIGLYEAIRNEKK